MDLKKEISIIIPIHNEELILKRQIESLCKDISGNVSKDF